MLTSCGGGSGAPSGGPTPTPTPTATVTPLSTPTFSYSTFDQLAGDQDFGAACEIYSPRGNGVPFADGSQPSIIPGNIVYTQSSDSWIISEKIDGGGIVTFGPAGRDNSSSNQFSYAINSTNPPSRLDIFATLITGGTAVYGRGLNYLLNTGSNIQTALCSIGVPTHPDDIPASPSINWDQLGFGGLVFDENPAGGAPIVSQIVGGSGSITGNTMTGELSFSLFYTIRDPSGAETTIGPVQGVAPVMLADDRAGFLNTLNTGAPTYRINGSFYGPQGTEIGYIMTGSFDQNGDGLNERLVLLGGYAKRNVSSN